jgi:hypothetical protein
MSTFTYPPDGGAGDAGSSCMPVCSGSSGTINCTVTSMGYTTTVSGTFTISGNGYSGTESSTTTAPDGGVLASCTYSVSATKM